MLTTQRKQYLLDVLKRDGQIVAKRISEELDLSEDTIRRDLRELAAEGLLQRVHGGALPASPALADFAGREQIQTDGKTAIGATAARMIRAGQVVILDGGTTAAQVARHLPRNLQATIVTHSPRTAVELVDHPSVEVILIGGRLYKHSIVAVGTVAIESIAKIHADVYFMGVTGVHPDAGLTTGDYEEAQIKAALSAAAAETWVLASREKLGAASPYVVMPLSESAGLIIEDDTPEGAIAPFVAQGIAVVRTDES